MKSLTTHIPPVILKEEGEVWVEVVAQIGETTHFIRAPAGDGAYLFSQVCQKIVEPRLRGPMLGEDIRSD